MPRSPAEEGIAAAKHDAEFATVSDNGHFRCKKPVASEVRGQPVWVIECEEYIDGRWEGFVSIAPRHEKRVNLSSKELEKSYGS